MRIFQVNRVIAAVDKKPEDVITIKEAATLTGWPQSTISRMMDRGEERGGLPILYLADPAQVPEQQRYTSRRAILALASIRTTKPRSPALKRSKGEPNPLPASA